MRSEPRQTVSTNCFSTSKRLTPLDDLAQISQISGVLRCTVLLGHGKRMEEGRETKAENEVTAVPDVSTSNVLLTFNMNFNHDLNC